jgi:hypothetical protein
MLLDYPQAQSWELGAWGFICCNNLLNPQVLRHPHIDSTRIIERSQALEIGLKIFELTGKDVLRLFLGLEEALDLAITKDRSQKPRF